MFENKNNFTINKLYEIFNLFLKLINEDINKEINKFQDELNEETKDKIIDYFKKEHIISKNDFFNAIRLFISLVLFLEEDKRKTILDGKEVDCPRFLFDMLSDLLVKDENNNWIPAYEFERKFLEKNKKSD